MIRRRVLLGIPAAFGLTAKISRAQSSIAIKPIKLIVPYTAGGLPDLVARAISKRLSERMGQPVVVDNRPGGSGVVAYRALMQHTPSDGNTFIVTDGAMLSIAPLLLKNSTYKYGSDLIPVSLIATSPLYLVVNSKSKITNFQEFIHQVRGQPDVYTYGTSGVGSAHHLSMESIMNDLGLRIRHIPYKGSSQSIPALVAGQIDFSIAALPSVSAFVKNNQLRMLASNAAVRSTRTPSVPAIAEYLPGHDYSVKIGLLASSVTPNKIIREISKSIEIISKESEYSHILDNMGVDPTYADERNYDRLIRIENEMMLKVGKKFEAELK